MRSSSGSKLEMSAESMSASLLSPVEDGSPMGLSMRKTSSLASADAPRSVSSLPPPTDVDNGGGGTLSTLMGVFLPCILSIFGVILFLRLGWAVGEAGLYVTLVVFALATVVVVVTVLSLAAISTNGQMKGGGAYFMISRSLGPELGGSVGLLFYVANALGTTFYVFAFAEEVQNRWFQSTTGDGHTRLLIATLTLVSLLAIGIVGAGFFTKILAGIFLVLSISIAVAEFSFLFGPHLDKLPHGGDFRGPRFDTFRSNLTPHFSEGNSFKVVFAICFPALTGIMAGANMSGDLKDPGRSIGRGTLGAIGASLVVYVILIFTMAASVDSHTLQKNIFVMQEVSVLPIAVVVGILCSTYSSGIGALVGGARVLQALARDDLIPAFRPFAKGSGKSDEPRRAVLLTFLIAEAGLFLPSLNAVASLVSNFFLLSYCVTNFACFALRVTGAPNFRPSFRYFNQWTALFGFLLCFIVMFYLNPVYAAISVIVMIAVMVYIYCKAPPNAWGSLAQALIYHQVRKFLLQLDERQYHPKYWRPSVLLLVDSPVNNVDLIDFCNNLKKGGLYVLGSTVHGTIGTMGQLVLPLRHAWLDFIDAFKLKAFAEVSIAPTARLGAQTLMLMCGLGGLKPNTVVVPFYEAALAEGDDEPRDIPYYEALRASLRGDAALDGERSSRFGGNKRDFVGILHDALLFNKNVAVARNFSKLDKELIVQVHGLSRMRSLSSRLLLSGPEKDSLMTVDVWSFPDDDPDGRDELTMQLQLAQVLAMTDIWARYTRIRVMKVVSTFEEAEDVRASTASLMKACRIFGQLEIIVLEDCDIEALMSTTPPDAREQAMESSGVWDPITLPTVKQQLMAEHSEFTCVNFLALPRPPAVDCRGGDEIAEDYLGKLDALTFSLPPTFMVTTGEDHPVVTAEL
eukprot:PLAT14754.2.p1 GENE.PLAT14754.2~~PLAT14754.2.p1  ORF type:complete len:912 (+),score=500.85 PLAT14754.2:57-2792(+)